MDDLQHLQSDLRFVRDSVTQSGSRGPAGIYFLWSLLTMTTYAWSMVGVALAVALMLTGIREARRRLVHVQAV